MMRKALGDYESILTQPVMLLDKGCRELEVKNALFQTSGALDRRLFAVEKGSDIYGISLCSGQSHTADGDGS